MGLRSACVLLFLMASIARAQTSAPGLHPSWLRLLHYQSTWSGSLLSSITSPEFFLSSAGARDPEAEWKTLAGTWDPAAQKTIACRFPARVLLYQKLSGQTWPAAPCPDYVEWKKGLSFHSLSLVYSTAYAGNPASVLGHNILKLNLHEPMPEDQAESGLPLLDYGIGFLARHDPEDDPVSYMVHGLFGGYPGFFVLQPYYELVNTYAYAENRDLWELEIHLSPMERELFLAHVWELIHRASSPYYFTHVNCSTMLLEILEAVRPNWNLRDRIPGLVLPQAVMQTVAEVVGPSRDAFWPSQKRIFDDHWRHLNAEQQEKFLDWRQTGDSVAVADDPRLLDTIMHQLNLKKAGLEPAEQIELRAQEDQILLARSRLPASTLQTTDRTRAGNNPLLAHGLHKFSLLAGRDQTASLLALRLRWGLHDLLDEPQGFNPYYHINFFDLRLWQAEGEPNPDYNLEIFDLMSLTPFERVAPAGSWAVSCGLHKEAEGPRPHCRGGYGLAWEWAADRSLFYVLPGMNLTITGIEAEMRLGWYQAWTARWRQLLEIRPRKAQATSQGLRWDWTWEQRWSLNRRWQLEWRLVREESWQTLAGVGQFF
ncbi:Lnb N-terminal periplasmic domain-containing protein [Oligoflexus tunisiensis]|uniref:Lnb N-terminal periplasmic domain-containing protein n=1 Tax=Oligoflexus tunisiensis TaxID=708132 RepID=UPI00114CE899|nr:DUF4105 domain-containing protein [Oligoflexus tunisiensis]